MPTQIDSLPLSWAVHNLSGISSPANAAYKVLELCHQIKVAKSKAIFTCLPLLNTALAAATRCGISQDKVYLLSMPDDLKDQQSLRASESVKSVDQLIQLGATLPEVEPLRWQKGQGARQCAFLMFSSGTTGLPVSF